MQCNHEPKEVISIGKISYYASDIYNIRKFDGDLVVNLSGITNLLPVPNHLQELSNHIVTPDFEELMIPWPDFGTPSVAQTFWQAIHQVCKKKKFTKVCVHCKHGHGRTGTALSALLIANCGFSATKAVDFVRVIHCESSVESKEQCVYLAQLDATLNGRSFCVKTVPLSGFQLKSQQKAVPTGKG